MNNLIFTKKEKQYIKDVLDLHKMDYELRQEKMISDYGKQSNLLQNKIDMLKQIYIKFGFDWI